MIFLIYHITFPLLTVIAGILVFSLDLVLDARPTWE